MNWPKRKKTAVAQLVRGILMGVGTWSAVGLVSGCQVPAYRLPGGFSSTYHRQLHAEPILPIVGPESLSEPEPPAAGVFYPSTVDFDSPTRSEFRQTALLPEPPTRRR